MDRVTEGKRNICDHDTMRLVALAFKPLINMNNQTLNKVLF